MPEEVFSTLTLFSFKELLLLNRFGRNRTLLRGYGLVGEVQQVVSTGLLAGKDSRIPSSDPLPSVDSRCRLALTLLRPRGGRLLKDERCLPIVSGESREKTSSTLSGDCVLSLGLVDFAIIQQTCVYLPNELR